MSDYNSVADINSLFIVNDDSVVEELSLPVRFQFIYNFNGDRSELTSFIENINSAF